MYKIETKTVARLIAGLLLCNISYADDAIYLKSSEPCLVTAYTAPGTEALSEKLKCGEKANLLERQGDFARVRFNGGKTIWINQANVSQQPPAEQEVQRLLAYQKKIEAELTELNKQVKSLSESSEKLIKALIAAEAAKSDK